MTDGATLDPRLAAFDAAHAELERVREALETRLRDALAGGTAKIHSIGSRTKRRESLSYKLSRPERTYRSLWDVTDVVALRVTTYFEDAIAEVARVVEGAFVVDLSASRDRLQAIDPATFGYRSLHYVAFVPPELRGSLPAEVRVELQIRTVLQHAWAEVEHDLGYKGSETVPAQIRRRFSRVASLLEVADEEFVALRKATEDYARTVADGATRADALALDPLAIERLARGEAVASLDGEVGALLERPLREEVFFPDYLAKMLRLAGLSTTTELQRHLASSRELALALVQPYFAFADAEWSLSWILSRGVPRGYGLFFLAHAALLRSETLSLGRVARLTRFYRELDFPDDEAGALRVASGLYDAMRAAGLEAMLAA